MNEVIPGVNIQWPWSILLLSGEKTVETRSYPLPKKYEGQWLAVIETPGPRGKREARIEKARITGKIMFSGSFQYLTRSQWAEDFERHRVDLNDEQFGFSHNKDKWGWVVQDVQLLSRFIPPPSKRGIVFASQCSL